MTEIARREPRVVDDGYLIGWAESARAAASIAQSLARTPFVPASLRDRDRDVTVGNITAAILTGSELGLTPMAALRSIDIIQGTPSLRAVALRALVQAAGHDIVVAESNSTRAIVRGRRHGSDEWQTSTWTIDRAKTMGLLGREQWQKQPTSMLVARATAECARLVAADVILAIPYIAEELQDGEVVEDVPYEIEPPKPARRTAQRRTRPKDAPPPPTVAEASSVDTQTAAVPEDEPPLDETPVAQPTDKSAAPPPDMITSQQVKAIQAMLSKLGIRGHDERIAIIRDITGRAVDSTNHLYRLEASTVIDELRRRELALAQADEDAALEAAYEAEQLALQEDNS